MCIVFLARRFQGKKHCHIFCSWFEQYEQCERDERMKQRGSGAVNKIAVFLSMLLVFTAVMSTITRAVSASGEMDFALLAAGLAIPQGNMRTETLSEIVSARQQNQAEAAQRVTKPQNEETTKAVEAAAKNAGTEPPLDPDAKTFPIIESQYGEAGVGYENFYVKNTTDYVINFSQLLSSPLGFEMEDTPEPQVLIVHTHTTESYVKEDLGYYIQGQEFRSTDGGENIIQVGNAITDTLKKYGIGVVHATEYHDDPAYVGSYDRSEQTIYKYMEEYPSIKVVLDIHRDSIGYDDDRGKIKPTFVAKGKKAAQIMIMSGYDPYNSYGFPDWEENLKFALRLQQKAETMYPGMTRPLYFGDFAYNMFINPGSLLIEMGTDVNTLDEAVYSGELLAEVLASVLKSV